MRNLTIHRQKAYAGCAVKMKVYIRSEVDSELTIGGVPCRKLGELRNGEEQTFVIEDAETRVYVIADKLSKDSYNEYRNIPAGTEDVVLTGKCLLNPAQGNPFRFDGEADADVVENRKRTGRRSTVIMVIAVIVGLLLGLGRALVPTWLANKPQEFTSNGMHITLTADFDEGTYEGLTVCYESRDTAILALKEDFTLLPGLEGYTLEEYFQLVHANNGMDSSIALKEENGVRFFEYRSEVDEEGTEFYYLCAIYKAPDAFWMIHFSTPVESADRLRDNFLEYAASVTFDR